MPVVDLRPLKSTPGGITVDSIWCDRSIPFHYLTESWPMCIPTEAEIRVWQQQELATTSLTPEAQAAALEAGDAAIAADRSSHEDDYCASDAVEQSPWLSQMFGAETVCKFGGPDGALLKFGLIALVVVAGASVVGVLKK